MFQQRPIYSMYGSLPACAPTTGRVCHGFELPYVFGEIANAYQAATGETLAADATDHKLAQEMVEAWIAFARDPYTPPLPWSRSGADALTVWGDAQGGLDNAPRTIAQAKRAAQCGLWDASTR